MLLMMYKYSRLYSATQILAHCIISTLLSIRHTVYSHLPFTPALILPFVTSFSFKTPALLAHPSHLVLELCDSNSLKGASRTMHFSRIALALGAAFPLVTAHSVSKCSEERDIASRENWTDPDAPAKYWGECHK